LPGEPAMTPASRWLFSITPDQVSIAPVIFGAGLL
jgi:hypothetical protein